MQTNPVPTELTTAATDGVLAVFALVIAFYLWQLRQHDPWKVYIWSILFCLLAVASVLAAIAHGFILSVGFSNLLWYVIYLALGIVVSLFLLAAVYDLRGLSLTKKIAPFVAISAMLFFFLVQLMDGDFKPFIIYEALAMLAAFAVYAYLALFRRQQGAGWMLLGIALTILAALFQVFQLGAFHLIWQFDHNGVYHLIQLVGLCFIFLGLHVSLKVEGADMKAG
ncbi:MAG: hypothetical protein KZQ85_07255 [Candidatus Thiodiazotropha sp. (ex Myrtea sp. 'scaly one' KF741663)]|nr:hypothetical protein [Candidatus Thiodiazotropha sp. (ex Myrtea sp. 'scaly one' KF741663)]